ncbi:MAG: protein kinase [Deltaproteobacteria bacterium]|nr:protein kinase [Deltaproteobacteria bacterium]
MSSTLGPLTIGRRLGAGGMAEVFEGELGGRRVAVKLVHAEHADDRQYLSCLLDEARVLQQLAHPHVVQVLGCGDDGGRAWVALELVEGPSLARVLEHTGKLDVEDALAVCLPLLEALDYVHGAKSAAGAPLGIVHRDVSAHNVLLSVHGDVKLGDFGIAMAPDRLQRTATGAIKGKLRAMAPEQAAGLAVDARADQFAAALLLFECLVGEPAYRAKNDAELFDRVRQGDIPELRGRLAAAGVDDAMATAIARALSRRPEDRFSSCRALLDALAPHRRDAADAARARVAALVARDGQQSRTAVTEVVRRSPSHGGRSGSDLPLGLDLPERFQVRRELGRGGMGVVLAVQDRSLGREVAVKVLPADKRDPVHRTRFSREAKAAAVLRHPNIVTVFDVDLERDFIVMELVRGESLRALLKRDRTLPLAELRRVALALLDALAAAHDARIVHRDVKPANILIDEQGVVKLVDFGVASFGDRDLTSSGVSIGTPAYMAPEQLRGRVADVRADLYATGATLFEAATGEELHTKERTPSEVAAAVLSATGDRALADAIARAVAQRPEDRFANAREFAAALGPPSAPVAALTSSTTTPALTALPPRRGLPAALLTMLAAGAAGAVALLWQPHEGSEADAGARAGELRSIALLPFADHTGEARLDFASSGLPHILAAELRGIPELTVIGYYQLLDRVGDAGAAPAIWREAARALGAEELVRGELSSDAGGVRLVVVVESLGGATIGRFERITDVDAVPGAARALAADVAGAAVGRATVVGESRPFEVERSLQLAIAALERQDFAVADEQLQLVELKAPDLAEAWYHRALLNWWLSRDTDGPATRALAGNLGPAERGFMEGLRLVTHETHLTPAIDHFRALVANYPDHRDIQYGLFEALYHGGYAREAMVVYRRLCEGHPRFRLGLKHALATAVAHGDDGEIGWALARLDPNAGDSVLWQARAAVARRDYDQAIALLRRHEAPDDAARAAVQRELAAVYLLDGQLDLAADVAAGWQLADMLHHAAPLLGLAMARGKPAEVESWGDKAAAAAELATGSDERERGWIEVAAVELPEAQPTRLRRIHERFGQNERSNRAVARALVAGALGERAVVEQERASEFPEAAAVADAHLAEWAKDERRAVAAWTRAAGLVGDATFLIVEQGRRARAARALGDHATVLAACDEVIRPRRFTWAWGGAVGPCLQWSAEAEEALGRPADARAAWQQLRALRAQAPETDNLRRAALDGVVRTGAGPAAP